MSTLPPCPQCASAYTYEDGAMLVCPECGHEWSPLQADAVDDAKVVRDAVGNLLADGDSVVLVKDLAVKGAGQTLKVGACQSGSRLG